MGPAEAVVAFLINILDFFLLFQIISHMTPLKKQPVWKVSVFILILTLTTLLTKTLMASTIPATVICCSLSIVCVMLFFGWKLSNAAAYIAFMVISIVSEITVTLFMMICGFNLYQLVITISVISGIAAILSRVLESIITYAFIQILKPKVGNSYTVLTRFTLLGLINIFLILMCITFVFIWTLENKPVPGWFIFIYLALAVAFAGFALITQNIAMQNIRKREELKLIDMQGELSLEVQRSVEQLKEYEHNYRKHLQTILALTHDGMHEDAERYYGELVKDFDHAHISIISNMPALSATIQRFKVLALKKGIEFEADISPSVETNANELHLCVLLSNLLENAVEACERAGAGSRISLTLANSSADRKLLIRAENTYDAEKGRPRFYRDLPLTSKTDSDMHGYGLRSVKRIVDTYNGKIALTFSENDGIFKAEITI